MAPKYAYYVLKKELLNFTEKAPGLLTSIVFFQQEIIHYTHTVFQYQSDNKLAIKHYTLQ